jgi:tartrate dehydratase beta subunit/fumarate hydratase class I family protein
MLYVGFIKHSMASATPTTSTIMNSIANSIILTEHVSVKLLVCGREVLQLEGGQYDANS